MLVCITGCINCVINYCCNTALVNASIGWCSFRPTVTFHTEVVVIKSVYANCCLRIFDRCFNFWICNFNTILVVNSKSSINAQNHSDIFAIVVSFTVFPRYANGDAIADVVVVCVSSISYGVNLAVVVRFTLVVRYKWHCNQSVLVLELYFVKYILDTPIQVECTIRKEQIRWIAIATLDIFLRWNKHSRGMCFRVVNVCKDIFRSANTNWVTLFFSRDVTFCIRGDIAVCILCRGKVDVAVQNAILCGRILHCKIDIAHNCLVVDVPSGKAHACGCQNQQQKHDYDVFSF